MARCDEMREGEEAEESCRIDDFVCCGAPLALKED
jgi:hypothetical protein